MSQSIESLIRQIKALPDVNQRAVSAIVGATVADAAVRPLHWIYDQTKLNTILGHSKTPEFWSKSESPFYTRLLGERSPYNDIMLTMLKSLHKTNGILITKHLCETIKQDYGVGSLYHETYQQRKNWRRYIDPPINGPWLQSAVISFLENYALQDTGPYGDSHVDQNDAFCLVVPLIVKNSDDEHLWSSLKDTASLLSTHSLSTKYFHAMTILLQAHVQNKKNPVQYMKDKIYTIYPDVYEKIMTIDDYKNKDYAQTAARFGIACYQPGTFVASYLAMEKTKSYVDAIRLNITAGGDTASRSNIIGSCFGAKYGIDGIPIEWMKKTKDIENIMVMAIEVMSK